MAQIYTGENDVYELIKNFSSNYHKYIKIKDGVEWVENPVNSDENFADKWQIHPERKKAFNFFITELNKDIINKPDENVKKLIKCLEYHKQNY